MVVALSVLLVTSMLLTGVFFALQGEIHSGTNDLSAKRAYAAAQAGVQAYLYELDQNPNYWETCANDTSELHVPSPGAIGRCDLLLCADLRQRKHGLHEQHDQLAGRHEYRHDPAGVHGQGRHQSGHQPRRSS